jgi:hypothetical protein
LRLSSEDHQFLFDGKDGVADRLRLIRAGADDAAFAADVDQQPEPRPSATLDREIHAEVALAMA